MVGYRNMYEAINQCKHDVHENEHHDCHIDDNEHLCGQCGKLHSKYYIEKHRTRKGNVPFIRGQRDTWITHCNHEIYERNSSYGALEKIGSHVYNIPD